MALEIPIQAPINFTPDHVRQALALLVKQEHNIEIDPNKITWKYTGQYDSQEFDGATIDLDLNQIKQLVLQGQQEAPAASQSRT